jgi:cytochrome oxidase Cu insertion factor (SCO1/SenC/PrrC family)
MRRNLLVAPLVVGLSLCGLSCQKFEPAGANGGGGANASNASNSSAAPGQPPAAPQTHLKVGDRAPDFELTDTEGQAVRLADFRGKKNVVLAFYVLAFTGG